MKILLFREHRGDPLCDVIAALTRGQYTHAAVLTNEATLEIHEAYAPRVRVRTLAPGELAGIDVFNVLMTPAQEGLALLYYGAHVGDDYAFLDLARFLPMFRKILGDDTAEGAAHHCFCSMYVFQGLIAAGIVPLARIEPWEVSPNELSYSPLLAPAGALEPSAFVKPC